MVGTIGLSLPSTMLPMSNEVRSGLPSLKMTTPEAPAACAFSTLTPKLHPPRWIKAIRPATKPLKSADVQPLVELVCAVGGRMMPPAAWRRAFAEPIVCPGPHSSPSEYVCAVGEASLNTGGAVYA